MPHRPIIAVDMDEVIADALGEHLLRYNRDFDECLTPADLHGRWIWDYVPLDRQPILEQYIRSDDFFSNLAVMPDAQRVLERLQSRYDIFIASAAMEVPTSFTPKFNWLARHFPFIPPSHIVFCGAKSILRADYLIDDNPRQLRLFEQTDPAQTNPAHATPAHANPAETTPTQPTSPFTPQRREGILFTSPANAAINTYRRINNWQEAESLFLP